MSIYILMPPLLFGIINKTKAYLAGRKGAPLLQPYYDLIRLFKKKMVISGTTTWVFYAGPIVTFISVMVAGLLMPLGQSQAVISFTGDFILFAYLFGLARFFTTIAAMDTGSAFEGMGAAREMTFSAITEPGLFFAFLVFVKLSGSMSLTVMLQRNLYGIINQNGFAPIVMVIIGLAIILLAENSRMPVDDPNTHLELTMIHEVMVLDHSGPLLGLIQYAANVKFFILSSFLCTIILPTFTSDGGLSWVGFLIGIILIAVGVGIVESIMARLRMSRVTVLLFSAFLLCGSALIIFVR
ncbi:MAG: NADH-quinone oxidoreductase subunit H [Peptostreptococcaceae bacterium]|nr:NADH-quinone oxidoreductase subunit H [Peptostreptococcaceae bacterium]